MEDLCLSLFEPVCLEEPEENTKCLGTTVPLTCTHQTELAHAATAHLINSGRYARDTVQRAKSSCDSWTQFLSGDERSPKKRSCLVHAPDGVALAATVPLVNSGCYTQASTRDHHTKGLALVDAPEEAALAATVL